MQPADRPLGQCAVSTSNTWLTSKPGSPVSRQIDTRDPGLALPQRARYGLVTMLRGERASADEPIGVCLCVAA